jgi:hypothetical protein
MLRQPTQRGIASQLDSGRAKIIEKHYFSWSSEVVARERGTKPPTFRFSDLDKTVQEHSSNLSVLAHDV